MPEAVDNPLFGLPPIPKTHDLPETPFLFLKRYERQHAEIFFGRSYYIRDLYHRVSDRNAPPIILLYGNSGVGKSSLFDAGLNPRLENEYEVIYARRDQEKGVFDTLNFALGEKLAALSESKKPKTAKSKNNEEHEASQTNEALLKWLESAPAEASGKLKQEIEALAEKLKS